MALQALCYLPYPHPLWVVDGEVDAYIQRELSAAGKYELEEGGDRDLIDIVCVGIIGSASAARSAVAGVVVKQCADVQFGPDMAGSCGQIAPAAAHASGNNTVSERKEVPDGAEDLVGEAVDRDITGIVTTQYWGNNGSDAALKRAENFDGRVSSYGISKVSITNIGTRTSVGLGLVLCQIQVEEQQRVLLQALRGCP